MSVSEEYLNDVSKAKDILDKVGDTFKDFQSHSLSIKEKWLILQNSLLEVHNSLENRVKEVESKEIDMEASKRRLQNLELRCEEFESKERSMEERLKEVNMKEKEVKERCEGLDLREKRLFETEFEKLRAVNVRVEEVSHREERCCLREKEVEENANGVKLKEKELSEFSEELKSREEELKSRETKLSKFSEELKSKDKELSEFREDLKSKENVLSERFLVLERKEEELKKKEEDLESKEKETDELYDVVMLKEKELNEERDKLVAQEMMLREKELNEEKDKLVAQEKMLRSSLEEVDDLKKGIELKERGIAEREKELEAKEKKYQEDVKIMGLKRKVLSVRLGSVETREKDVEEKFLALRVKEKRINEKSKALDLREKELNEREKELNEKEKEQHGFELEKKEIIELCEKIGLKGKQVNEGHKALELKEKQIDNPCKDVILKEKDIDKRFQAREMKEKHVRIEKGHEAWELKEERSKVMEKKEKEVMELREAIELKKKEIDKRNEALESKEMQIEERCKQLEPKEKELNEQYQVPDTIENDIAYDVKALEFTEEQMNEKQNREPCLVEEFTEKQIEGCSTLSRCDSNKLSDAQVVDGGLTQISQDIPHSHIPQSGCIDNFSPKLGGEIRLLCRNMDPDGVRSFLIEHVKDPKLINEELSDALQSAPDSAKLVLDVSQNFHKKFPCLNQTNATKKSCIYLLEQLVKLSPPISLNVKEEAKVFAAFWKDSLKGADDVRSTYGFLQFLAAFKLASLYDAKELVSLFDIFYCQNEVYRPGDNQYLCCVLGLSKEIPGLIKFHIRRENWLLALKYVCVFKLESNFPPVSLLEAHMASIKRRVNDIQKDGTLTSKSQASYLELTSLEEVVKCVTSFKLEHEFPINSLVSRIQALDEFKENRKFFALTQMKKRKASTCSDEQDKHPRVGSHDHNTHQRDYTAFPQPFQLRPIHMTPNLHPNWRRRRRNFCNTYDPHLLFDQFVPPGNHPFGAPIPVYYGVEAEMGPRWPSPPGSTTWPVAPGVDPPY